MNIINRCQVCRRTVGLWSLYTIADQLKKVEEKEEEPTTPGKRKNIGTLADSEDDGKNNPKKSKEQEKGEESDAAKCESTGGRTLRKRSKSEERASSPDKNQRSEGSCSPQKTDSQEGRSPRRSKRKEEAGSSSKKVDEGWSMQLRGRRVSDQSSDDGSSSGTRLRGRHISEQSSDESACGVGGGSSSTQQEHTTEDTVTETPRSRRRARRAELAKERLESLSPLIIGSSPSTQIQKVLLRHFLNAVL